MSSSRPGLIDWFYEDEEHGFLCNFWRSAMRTTTPEGRTLVVVSLESAFQAHKVLDEGEFVDIALLDPGRAKAAGNATPNLRPDWDEVKFGIMEELIAAKFMKGSTLAAALLRTGDDELVEGTTWHDTIWGVCICEEHEGKGDNHLGRLLMERRSQLREGKA